MKNQFCRNLTTLALGLCLTMTGCAQKGPPGINISVNPRSKQISVRQEPPSSATNATSMLYVVLTNAPSPIVTNRVVTTVTNYLVLPAKSPAPNTTNVIYVVLTNTPGAQTVPPIISNTFDFPSNSELSRLESALSAFLANAGVLVTDCASLVRKANGTQILGPLQTTITTNVVVVIVTNFPAAAPTNVFSVIFTNSPTPAITNAITISVTNSSPAWSAPLPGASPASLKDLAEGITTNIERIIKTLKPDAPSETQWWQALLFLVLCGILGSFSAWAVETRETQGFKKWLDEYMKLNCQCEPESSQEEDARKCRARCFKKRNRIALAQELASRLIIGTAAATGGILLCEVINPNVVAQSHGDVTKLGAMFALSVLAAFSGQKLLLSASESVLSKLQKAVEDISKKNE